MGAVYRAVDHTTGDLVAVKELHGLQPEDQERFARECAFLASLEEPGIVRYVAHGTSETGSKFLAMEWVDGPTLSEEIKRRGFSVRESVEIIKAVAKSVSAVHRRGIVHRDIKPSNIVLQSGDHRRPKLLDFGVARLAGKLGAGITASGMVIGSAGYLSPEQASGQKDIDVRSDVFSLGCLMFKCLTGSVPFRGDDPIGILLKISLEQAPRVRELLPRVPEDVDGVVATLLARDREARPRDASEVGRLLESLSPGAEDAGPASLLDDAFLSAAEQRLAVLILARKDPFGSEGSRWAVQSIPSPPTNLRTSNLHQLERAVAPFGVTLEAQADGTLIGTVTHPSGPATELAIRAARAIDALRAVDAKLFFSLSCGRAKDIPSLKIGDTVDRGINLLTHVMLHGEAGEAAVDTTIAALLDPSHEIDARREVARLGALRPPGGWLKSAPRTPFTGRDPELTFLRGLLEQTIEDRSARCALVVADAKLGKSRLCQELLQRSRADLFDTWFLHAEPDKQGLPLGILGPVLAELGRMGGAGLSPSDLFSARVASGTPLLVVIEDAHFADTATVAFFEAAVRDFADRAIFVLSLARPEISSAFPNFFAGRRLQTLQLEPLSTASSSTLLRAVMPDAEDATIESLVRRARGNPFFLEQIGHAAAGGKLDELPDSVLATLDVRIDALSSDERRVMRAGSVYGATFWRGALDAMLPSSVDVAGALAELERKSLVARRRKSRYRPHLELGFVDPLYTAASYARIPENERRTAHQTCARWLESAGERDPVSLAEHYEHGGDGQSAVGLFAVAAHLALESSDLLEAVRLCERALACGAFGEERGNIHVTAAEARYWLGRCPEALAHARDGMARLPRGSDGWCRAASAVIAAAGKMGNRDALHAIAATVFALPKTNAIERVVLFLQTATELIVAGKLEIADKALSLVPQGLAQSEPRSAAWYFRARGWRALSSGDPCGCAMLMKRSCSAFEQVGDARNACVQRVIIARIAMMIGQLDEALEGFESCIEAARAQGLAGVLASARLHAGLVQSWLTRFDEAEADLRRALDGFRKQRDERMIALSAALYARVVLERHRVDEAETLIREGLAMVDAHTAIRALLLATHAQTHNRRAMLVDAPVPEAALKTASEVQLLVGELGELDEGEGYIRWSIAQIIWESGNLPEALRVVSEARTHLEQRAARITLESARDAFLQRIPEHALTIALHRVLCGA